jgi:uncharacterized protein YndB with AHSA1/START domain
MPTTRRSRTIDASPQELWGVVSDPHHLPRWWPRVTRVEAVSSDAFTEVLKTPKGRVVRADFRVVALEEPRRLRFAQQLDGTPFARLLAVSETEIQLVGTETDPGTCVTLELHYSLRGFFSRFGGYMVRRAGGTTLEEALDGLQRILG